jgi:hypothetical protein
MPVSPRGRQKDGAEPEPTLNKRFYLDIPTNRRLRELARSKNSTEAAEIRYALEST